MTGSPDRLIWVTLIGLALACGGETNLKGSGGPGGSGAGGGAGVGGSSGSGGSGGTAFCEPSHDCSRESFCEVSLYSCGEPWSPYDAYGCPRRVCSDDGNCAVGERCLDTAVTLPSTCWPSSVSCSTDPVSGACNCTTTADCRVTRIYRTHCILDASYPRSDECDVSGLNCTTLAERLEELTKEYGYQQGRGHDSLLPQLDECRDRIVAALSAAACDS